ncbi:hypothetical protein A1O3_04253 [Capronia epimyces CBS 606.96]|uniref:RING-type domain-containing protein n=1 Tax=Capronia epimyces CBS 606.96 TaxID=1182542 RepID=W9YYB8_9EURO|nr:uncharacterized protein A1O3_04253 [Capronia epimyces CBS 606.96]EXJ87294.1 hypothetical protein A1O3_04253 [Capronia epimyces CBS 606.96]
MAASNLDASLAAIVSTLDWEKVPDKLHCASCHKFNLNAYKSTCCDGYICESCFNNARDVSCPVCDHKPFTSDVCKPNKAMRNTIKAYLKTVEKSRADERAKSITAEETPTQPNMAEDGASKDGQEEEPPATATVVHDQQQPVDAADADGTPAVEVQPSIEDPDPDSLDLDDDVDIQVELEDDHREISTQHMTNAEDTLLDQSMSTTELKANSQDPSNNNPEGMSGMDFSNMMNGFNNMDYNQMMQMMAANGMTGFNPMMGMPMGMNPMSAGMFGGFGGPNGGMNGLNMGMNFNPTQGMFSGWNNGQPNNNMWQNNNANAFSNGMGGDLGSNYGFNMAPNGNFQQSYPNGDFQSGYYGRGYGRGRGRGRGGFGRGRGNFHQYSQYHQQGHQNGFDQRQYDSQASQSQTTETRPNDAAGDQRSKNAWTDTTHEDAEFAPGGQEEVLEALGDDYQKPASGEKQSVEAAVVADDERGSQAKEPEKVDEDQNKTKINDAATLNDVDAVQSKDIDCDAQGADQNKPIPEAYNEDLQGPMPPPSAPLGPSAQYGDHMKDFGFRSRGHGRFPSRGRGMMPMSNGRPASPVKPHTQAPALKGVGVIGAPTGPRAMREPPAPARSASRSAATGFQIMGRASMAPRRSESRDFEPASSSRPPTQEQDEARDRDRSRRPSIQDKHDHGRDEVEKEDEVGYRDKDKRHRRSKQNGHDDYDRETREGSYSRSDSADRRSSRRSRGDKEKSWSSTKLQPSRSRRSREDDAAGDHEMQDYDESVQSNRDRHDGDSRSKHRSSKSSRHDEREREREREPERHRERDRERDKDRDKERDRERDRDRDRDEKHRDRDRDRDRKRSRHDRHHEDDKPHDYDYDYDHDHDHEHGADDQESRHRSRRHKRDHRRDADDGGVSGSASALNGRSHHSRATSTATPSHPQASTSAVPAEVEKDPHTLEREARNRERMLKEQQRREKAAKANASTASSGGGGGSRRITYKYEDELERGLMEGERANTRWR